MKLDLQREIEIPEGVIVSVDNGNVIVKKDGKEAKREFGLGKLDIVKKDEKVLVGAKKATKRESKMIGTITAHIKNMIKGVGEDFIYKLEICNVHFPMNVKAEGDKVTIKSFLGEKVDRYAKILPNVKVEINGKDVIVSGHDLEKVGQTAANIEKAAKVKGRDRRVFQDGIFITEKPGRVI